MAGQMSRFYGIEIPAGESVILTPRVDEDLTGYEIINLTQIALGPKPGKGAHTLFIQTTENPNADSEAEEEEEDEEVLGPKIAIATLDAANNPHASVDLAVSLVPIIVSHNGSSSIFLAGYTHPADFPAGDEDFDDYDSEEEEDLEEIDYEDEEGVPNGVPLAGSDDEEEEEEESEEEPSPVPVAPAAGKRKGAAKAAQPAPTKKAKAAEPAKVAAATPASADDYINALKEVVKAKGSVRLADLGSAVKRPAKAPKLKVAIDKNKQLFKYDAKTDLVSLA